MALRAVFNIERFLAGKRPYPVLNPEVYGGIIKDGQISTAGGAVPVEYEAVAVLKEEAASLSDPREREVKRAVLVHVLDSSMRLLHPICPFQSEEIWQRLPGNDERWQPRGVKFCARAPYPLPGDALRDDAAERGIELLMSAVTMAPESYAERASRPVEPGLDLASDEPRSDEGRGHHRSRRRPASATAASGGRDRRGSGGSLVCALRRNGLLVQRQQRAAQRDEGVEPVVEPRRSALLSSSNVGVAIFGSVKNIQEGDTVRRTRSITARSLSATIGPLIVANRSCPLAANAAVASSAGARSSARPRSVSAEVKNHSGARASSAIAVIGRGATPAAPSMTVRSSSRCFQSLASSSLVSAIVVIHGRVGPF